MTITIHTLKGYCYKCEYVKTELAAKHIEFVEDDNVDNLLNIADLTGINSAPIIEVKNKDDHLYFGNVKELEEYLNDNGQEESSLS
jgi:hypothetical protein